MYRFVKVTSFYRGFLQQYYAENPEILMAGYQQQFDHLMSKCFGWADFYARHLRLLGVDAHELVYNAEPLQAAWAAENGIQASGKDVIFAQIKKLQPDVVFFQDSFIFNGEWIQKLRQQVPSIKKIIGWRCSPFSDEQLADFRHFDFAFVCSTYFQNEFKRFGVTSHIIHHAFETSILEKLAVDNNYQPSDFVFIGSIIEKPGFHAERIKILEALYEKKVQMDFYANVQTNSGMQLYFLRSAYITARILRALGLRKLAEKHQKLQKIFLLNSYPQKSSDLRKIMKNAKDPVFGLEMYKALSRGTIGFNHHGEVAGDFACNVRLYEITGVGSCMVTDHKKDIKDFFEPDSEIITYQSADECAEKVRWLIDHPAECKAIALAGQKRVLQQHTIALRAARMHELISKELQKL